MSINDPTPPPAVPPPTTSGGQEHGRAGQVAGAVQSEGRQLAGSAADEARSVGQTVQQQVSRVGGEAMDQARGLVSSASSTLQDQAETQTHRLADVLRSAGEQARALADGKPDEAGDFDSYIRNIGGTLGEIAERIDRLGARGSMQELQDFARRRPGVFLAGAAAAGFMVSRFVRNAADTGSTGGFSSAQDQSLTTPSPITAPPAPALAPTTPPVSPPLGSDVGGTAGSGLGQRTTGSGSTGGSRDELTADESAWPSDRPSGMGEPPRPGVS